MSTDTDWLNTIIRNSFIECRVNNDFLRKLLARKINAAILQHESQAVKAADKAGRIDELKRIDGYAYGPDYGSYQEIRLKQLQGDSTGAVGNPALSHFDDITLGQQHPDHRTDMEL